MKCIECGNDKFVTKKMRFTPEVKGEVVEVLAECSACSQCSSARMNDEQMNAIRKAAADAYKVKHNLLTSSQIVKFRDVLGMSQTAFAAYLNVGEASVKRWETYYVQDDGQDEHMRLKCDQAYAEFNALQVHWKSHAPDTFNGNRRFSLEILKNTILYLLDAASSPLYLNKVLFYADFFHFKKYGKSLTGSRFVPLEYGPCPDRFQTIFCYLEEKGSIKKTGKHTFDAIEKAKLELFDDQEKETLKTIYELSKKDGGKHLYELAHKEIAFTKTAFAEPINYTHAKNLLM